MGGSLAADDGEVLEDGTGPRTPAGDNLVLDYARTEAEAFGSLVRSRGGRLFDDDEAGLHLRDLGVAHPFGNPALITRPVADADTDEVTARIRDFYAEQPGGPYLVLSPWRTTDWSGRGFQRVGHPPLMLRLPAAPPPPPEGVRLTWVEDAEQLAVFEETAVEAYPLPELQPWSESVLFGPSMLDDGWRLVLAYDGDTPVATAGAFVSPTVTLVEFVSLRPEARGRGIGTAVTAAAAAAAPDQPAMLVASDDGRGIYERLSFFPLLRCTAWVGLR